MAENLQREDLSAIESIEAIAEIVDAELIEDKEYAAMGKTPADRVKTLLGSLDSVRSSQERGSEVSTQSKALFHKFMEQVGQIFKNLPKPLEWRSFYNNDLPLLMDFCEEVREVSILHHLNKSQTRALAKLKETSEEEFQRIVTPVCSIEHSTGRQDETPALSGVDQVDHDFHKINISDLSAREIEEIADKAALVERNRPRRSPSLSLEAKILLMNRLGIPVDRIAARLKVNRKTVLNYSPNPRLVQSIRGFLEKGVSIPEVANKHGCPEPLVWSIALEGKSDRERFESLNWGLRTWDYWYFNEDISPGEFGEVIVKSDSIMKEYLKAPQATEQAIRDGWLYTGYLCTGQKFRQDKQDEQDFCISHHNRSLIYNSLDSSTETCF